MNTENIKRCAIYTRKSHEDGLEQEFNSLDAQRQAAENYIASQYHNGWRCIPKHYDDGGYSGGTIVRPALQELLRDAANGEIDIIVIYKIDRLSRSLLDFAELNKKFEEWNVSFVAVTQEINTSTSSGRMMLNILMTFAQYEREIISERIRDKMSASRRQGKWVGGSIPFGYIVQDKKLLVDSDQATVIQRIFKRFEEIQSPKQIAYELNSDGIKTRQGKPWDLGHIYRILNNHTYVGEVNYKGEVCKGEHSAIITPEVWNRTREILSSNTSTSNPKGKVEMVAPLKGILRCGHCDCQLGPTFGAKNGKRYPYYLCTKDSKRSLSICPIRRISATEIESVVIEQIGKLFITPTFVNNVAKNQDITGKELTKTFSSMQAFWQELYPVERNRLIELLVASVTVFENKVELEFRTEGMSRLIEEMKDANTN